MKATILAEIFVFLALHKLVSSACDYDEYFCRGTGKCIDSDYVCDGDNDCGDMEDERQCGTTTSIYVITTPRNPCSGTRFHCPFENRCVNPSWVCDGDEDCLDGTDERACQTTTLSTISSTTTPAPTYPISTTQISPDCDNEGNCKVICKRNGAFCLCENGYHLEVTGKSLNPTIMCVPPTNNPSLIYLLASTGGTSEMLGMDLITNTSWRYLKTNMNSIMRDIDFDSASDTLIWNDVGKNAIYSFKPMNYSVDTLMTYSSRDTPIHIQWDWIAKNLFFVAHRKIQCCDHTLKLCSTLHTHDDNLIWDFVIAPKNRYIFWNFLMDNSGTVYRSDMDGSNGIGIVQLYATWNTLAVDHTNERLYWASDDGTKIGSCDFNGQNRNGITLQRPFNLLSEIEIFENHLYFAHETQKHVERCSIKDGSCINLVKLERMGSRIQVIKIVHPSLQPDGENHCLNSGCQQLCLPNQLGFTCQCTDDADKSCKSKSVILELKDPVKKLTDSVNALHEQSSSNSTSGNSDLSWLKWAGCTFLVLCIVAVVIATAVFYCRRRSFLTASRLRKEESEVAAYSNMKRTSECRVSVGNLVNL